jgi:hypothetical protein
MPVIVLLSSDVQGDFTRGGSRLVETVRQVLRERGVGLQPMHPGSADAKLSRYYLIDISDKNTADSLILVLSNLPGIEAVYWKPADEAP